jgi:transposase
MNWESVEEFYAGLLGVEAPWEVESTERDGAAREVHVRIIYSGDSPVCPLCAKASPIHDHVTRKWRHLDSCNHKTIIEADVPRTRCDTHGVLQVQIPWAEKNSRFTAELERQVCMWLKEASITAVSEMFDLSWDVIAGIQDRAVRRGMATRKASTPKNIGIDETSFQKRHEYVTVIVDKDKGVVLDVLQDRKSATLDEWFKTQETADFRALESVSMDMWDAFIKAVKDNVADAERKIAFDRYHVAGHLGKAVDMVRANENRRLLKENGQSELVGTKYDWLRNSARTDNRSTERKAFMKLSRSNLKTARALRIKEAAGLLWDFVYAAVAEKRWKELIGWMLRSKLDPIIKVARMIKSYLWGILNAIKLKTTNAELESMNSGIQRIKRMACGYRNRDRFRMAILFHFGGLDLGFRPTR